MSLLADQSDVSAIRENQDQQEANVSVTHPFFTDVAIQQLGLDNFDSELAAHENELVGVFFWGHDCPNCEVAKTLLHQERETLASYNLRWFHVNVYENFDLATRFGLFGVPAFFFFYKGKKLGRISPFPTSDAFFEALGKLRQQLGLNGSSTTN